MHLDHVTLHTRQIARTSDFFRQVFDLEPGQRPRALQHIPGLWLYANGAPIVHIIGSNESGVDRGGEAIDHFAFRMTDYAGFRARLERLDIPYSTMDLAELQERRLFLRAPGGPLIEAVFSEPVPADTGPASH